MIRQTYCPIAPIAKVCLWWTSPVCSPSSAFGFSRSVARRLSIWFLYSARHGFCEVALHVLHQSQPHLVSSPCRLSRAKLNPVVSFLVDEQPFVLSQAQHSIVVTLAWWTIGLEALCIKQRGGGVQKTLCFCNFRFASGHGEKQRGGASCSVG